MSAKDTLYAQPLGDIANFSFDENVVTVFPDMIKRSVPGYSTIIAMTGVLAGRFAQANTRCYDLGCSLGASTLAMAQHVQDTSVEFIAVDNSTAMLKQCQQVISMAAPQDRNIRCRGEDILITDIHNASVAVLNFTLQFIAVAQRTALIQSIAEGMNNNGVLILSEKICFEDPQLQALNSDLHHQFKRDNGYSDLEISQKRSALEKVLVPESIAQHEQRILAAGFSRVDVWFQCFNFASFVAIK